MKKTCRSNKKSETIVKRTFLNQLQSMSFQLCQHGGCYHACSRVLAGNEMIW